MKIKEKEIQERGKREKILKEAQKEFSSMWEIIQPFVRKKDYQFFSTKGNWNIISSSK